MTQTCAEQLRAAAEPTWSAGAGHRFVTELFSGTIENDRLAHYLVQDYQFCDAFTRLLGQAVASAPSLQSRLGHARQLGFFAADENTYFTDTFDVLGVSAADRTGPTLSAVSVDFIELMSTTIDSRDHAAILTVLLAAEWFYLDWARREQPWPTDPRHRDWIEVHNNPDFVAWVDWLKAELDAAAPTEDAARTRLQELFVRVIELELAFFDDVYSDTAVISA